MDRKTKRVVSKQVASTRRMTNKWQKPRTPKEKAIAKRIEQAVKTFSHLL